MNIREMIEALQGVADVLPDGLDSPVRVHLCDGPDTPSIVTREFEVEPQRTVDRHTMNVRSSSAVVSVHAHRDPDAKRMTPANLDDELAQLLDADPEEPVAPTTKPEADNDLVIPPGTTRVVIDMGDGQALVMPLDENRKPITPGSARAVEVGCTCDPEKNQHGQGVDHDGDDVLFIYRKDCPVHRQIDPPGGLSITG